MSMKQTFSPHPRIVRINGVDLAYRDEGQGDPLVLIHGSAEDLRTWSRQLEPFSKRYRVIAYSRRYHYPNAAPLDGAEYSGSLHVADLAGLIEELDIGPAHLVGSSFGANVALSAGVRHPGLVRSLVLGEPPAMPLLEHNADGARLVETFTSTVWEVARQAFRRGEMEQGMRVFVDSVLGPHAFDRLSPSARGKMLQNAPEMRAELETAWERRFPPFTCSDGGTLDLPVLLLTGETSPRLFHLIADELERCLPRVHRATIPRVSHAIHGLNPQDYNTKVLTFLAQL